MKLYFKNIRFKNFMSFGNEWTEIDLTAAQSTLVIGKNGSGKSSAILDSISFVLFNKPFRNIRKPQVMNSITNKNCVVEVEFVANGYDFKVIRGLKPNIFEIYKDGELITQDADNRDYQDAFEKYILKVNHKTFCQIVMLGSAIFTPFMALPGPQRREVIEDLLDLQVFSAMNLLLKKKIDEVDTRMMALANEKKINETKLTMMAVHVEELVLSRDSMVATKEEQVKRLQGKIYGLEIEKDIINGDIAILVEKVADEAKIASKHLTITKLQHTLKHKVRAVNKEIEFFQEHDDCPTCHQIIDPVFKATALADKQTDYKEIETGLNELEVRFKEVDDKLGEIQETQKEINRLQTEIKTRDTEIKVLGRNINGLVNEMDSLKQQNTDIDVTKMDELKAEKAKLEKDYGEVNDDRNVMGYASNLLKDTGIKARIIKTYIPVINQLISKYLAALDFFVEFQLDENFQEVIRSRFRDEFTYTSFSQGEKTRLDIAILFTWRAIAKLRGSIDTNLIICDEIFDGSMDIDGLDDMMKLINNLTNNENVFIISHKEDQLAEKFSRVLKFVKTSNFSKMVT